MVSVSKRIIISFINMRRNNVQKISWDQSMTKLGNKLPVNAYSFESEEAPNQIPKKVCLHYKVSMGAKIRNRYNQVPHLTQDTQGKVTNSQLDTTIENQEVSPFPAGDNKAHINRRELRHSKHKTTKT